MEANTTETYQDIEELVLSRSAEYQTKNSLSCCVQREEIDNKNS